jgi:hypothetical protein
MSTSSIIDPFEKKSTEIIDPFDKPSTDVLSQIPGGAKSAPGTYIDQVPKGPSAFERGLQALAAVPVIGGGARLAQSALGAQRLYGASTAGKVGGQLLSALQPKTIGEAAKMAGGAFVAGTAGGLAEQAAQRQGAGPVVTQLAGMAGEMIPSLVTYPVSRAVERAVTPLIPSMRQGVAESLVRRLPQTVREGALPEVGVTRQQRLAGAKAELEGGAGTGGAVTVGKTLEDQANRLVAEMQTATADRVQRLQQDFDRSIRNIQDQSVRDAQNAVNRAFQAGARVRQNAAGQGAQRVQEAELVARQMEQDAANAAQQEALRVRTQIDDLIQRRNAAITESEKGLQEAGQGFVQFGERVTLSPIGQEARNIANPRLQSLLETRRNQVKDDLQAVESAVAAKGNASASDVPSAQQFSDIITSKLGLGGKAGQVDPERMPALKRLKKDVLGIQESVDDQGNVFEIKRPVSFNTLEEIRRRLRDRSYGDVEGLPAISKIEAGELADAVEQMQRDFVGGQVFGKYLSNYAQASKPINEFYTRLGRLLTEQTPFGERFVSDSAKIPARIFDSQESVNTFTSLIGGDQAAVNQLAVKYLNDQMRGGTAQDVARTIDNNRDWLALNQFKGLRDQLTGLQTRLAQAETGAARLGAAGKAAEAEIGQLAGKITQPQLAPIPAAEQIRREAAQSAEELSRQAAKRVTAFLEPRQEALRLAKESAASRLQKEVSEARGQLTGRISDIEKEAAAQADEIRKNLTFGQKNASDAFYQRLTGTTSQKDIEAMAAAIKQVPEATEAFKSAVRESLSRVPENRLMNLFDRNIEPALKASGLYRADELAEVRALVEAVDIARNAVERAKIAASKAVGTMSPEAAFTDEIRKEVVKARVGQASVTGIAALAGTLAGVGGQGLMTSLGIPAAAAGVFGTQAIRTDYAAALRRAVAEIVSNPAELRRVLATPEPQRPGLLMTLARNVLAAETGSLVPQGEINAP